MKLKEVCEATGLSRKTIRLYEEKGLISPQKERMNGRDYRDYTEEDVAKLNMIAMLRRAWFTMEEIRQMQEDPEAIQVIFPQYREWLRKQKRDLDLLIAVADAVQLNRVGNVEQLTEHMAEAAAGLPLPTADVMPHFRYLDEIEEVRNMEKKMEQKPENWQDPLSGGIKDDRAYRQFVAATSKTNDDNLAVAFGQLHEATGLQKEEVPVTGAQRETRSVRWLSRLCGWMLGIGVVLFAVMEILCYLDMGFARTSDVTGVTLGLYAGAAMIAVGFVGGFGVRGLSAYQERQRWIREMQRQDAEKRK